MTHAAQVRRQSVWNWVQTWWAQRRLAEPVESPGARSLPVRDGLDRATDRITRMAGFDQALLLAAVALVLLGVVMVYSASVALPDNPKFSRYAPTHFLARHLLSVGLAAVLALVVVQ